MSVKWIIGPQCGDRGYQVWFVIVLGGLLARFGLWMVGRPIPIILVILHNYIQKRHSCCGELNMGTIKGVCMRIA